MRLPWAHGSIGTMPPGPCSRETVRGVVEPMSPTCISRVDPVPRHPYSILSFQRPSLSRLIVAAMWIVMNEEMSVGAFFFFLMLLLLVLWKESKIRPQRGCKKYHGYWNDCHLFQTSPAPKAYILTEPLSF